MRSTIGHELARLLAEHVTPGVQRALNGRVAASRDVATLLRHLAPARTVHLDVECIASSDDLELVVGAFADATQGAWPIAKLAAEWDPDTGHAAIEFVDRGAHRRWDFEQRDSTVSRELLELIEQYAHDHLSGEFVELPARDDALCAIYLPRGAADALRELLVELEGDADDGPYPEQEELAS